MTGRASLGRTITIFAGVLVTAIAATPVAADTTVKFLMSWGPENTAQNHAFDVFRDAVEKASDGKVKVRRFGPEVVPPFEQLQPVSAGSFDMLHTHPAYHGGASAVGSIIDTVDPSIERRRKAGIHDWLDNYYQKTFNLKLLCVFTTAGYQILLKEPLKGSENLKGRKIRSNPAYDGLINALGGATVLLPAPQIYTAMQKGLVDGFAWPVTSLLRQKFDEVTKYMVRPAFGGANIFDLVHLDRWNDYDDATKQALEAGCNALQTEMPWYSQIEQLKEEQGMIKNGVEYTYFNKETANRINSLFNEGIWANAVKRSGKPAQELIDLIKEKDIANRG